jgi:hypothetical protein
MRFLASVVVVSLAGLVAAAGQSSKKEPELRSHESKSGRFKAGYTETPKSDSRSVASDTGKLEVTTVSAAVSRDLTLAVTWTDYPEKFQSVPADKLLDAVKKGMKTKDAKLVDEKAVAAHDPNPAGQEVHYDYGKYHVRARLFLVGTRLYQVTATGKKDEVEGRLADKFLASFQLIPR